MSLQSLKRFDNRISRQLQQTITGSGGRTVLAVIAHSADSAVLVPCLLILWWRHQFSRQSIVIPVALGFFLSVVVTTLVKFVVRRSRPEGDWGAIYRKTDPHSFPSGHASRTIAIALVTLAGDWLLIGLALLLWSFLVGLARIVLGVHYLYDVLAGYLLGLGIGLIMWLLMALDVLL